MRGINWRGKNRSSVRYAQREREREESRRGTLCVRDEQNCLRQIQSEDERRVRYEAERKQQRSSKV